MNINEPLRLFFLISIAGMVRKGSLGRACVGFYFYQIPRAWERLP